MVEIFYKLFLSCVSWFCGFLRDKKVENKIIEFLEKSQKEYGYEYRTTHAISSEINISEEKIRNLCNKSKRIKRNQKEKETWRLIS